jgi:ubiquinone biosynthesis protein
MANPTTPVADSNPSPSDPKLKVAGGTEFELLIESRPHGLLRRLISTWRHFFGTLFGGLNAWVRTRTKEERHGLGYRSAWTLALLTRPFVSRKLVKLPFAVQLRKRFETLGPTYIKLGQVLSLREDILPPEITEELKNLLDRLPALPFARYLELVEREIGRPVGEVFSWVEPTPLGSASIGQIHQATMLAGDAVIIKLVKPGIRETLKTDSMLLRIFGRFLQLFLARYQPKRVIGEFLHYTLREADLRTEGDNAETFAANFKDLPDVVFPVIYREFTTQNLLVMEYLRGVRPNDPAIQTLSEADRDRIVDLGATVIIRMLYRDGFFHADLHPGNLVVLPGPKAGFIDLGMVGRFDDELRRTLLYYYYCLVMGDAENAARYLSLIADAGPGSDVKGFRRDVEEICRRWQRSSNFEDFSIAQLIMESVGKGGAYRMYFPVEMVLMVKAIVTFEAVGQLLKPGFDVASTSKTHINQIFLNQFSPVRIARESLRGAPELVDALVKAPMLVTEGLRALEQATHRQPENPFSGIRGGHRGRGQRTLAGLGYAFCRWVAAGNPPGQGKLGNVAQERLEAAQGAVQIVENRVPISLLRSNLTPEIHVFLLQILGAQTDPVLRQQRGQLLSAVVELPAGDVIRMLASGSPGSEAEDIGEEDLVIVPRRLEQDHIGFGKDILVGRQTRLQPRPDHGAQALGKDGRQPTVDQLSSPHEAFVDGGGGVDGHQGIEAEQQLRTGAQRHRPVHRLE